MDLYCLEPLISPGILFEQLEGAKINYGMFYLKKKKKLSLSGSASLSSLMLLTQKVTSLSLDIREGKVVAPSGHIPNKNSLSEHLRKGSSLSQLLALLPCPLGGPAVFLPEVSSSS